MKTTIAQLKALTPGTEVRGFPLLIKTGRSPFEDSQHHIWQEVVFMDASGEILGHILLSENGDIGEHKQVAKQHKWPSKTNLCIMRATLQATDDRGKDSLKLVVTDCFDTATPLTYDQHEELTAEDWQRLHDEETAGKIRHGLTIAWIGSAKRLAITDAEKNLINGLMEFIKHG